MTFVKCDWESAQKAAAKKKNLRVYFEEFIASNTKTAKVVLNEGDYKSPVVARQVMGVAIKRGGFPIKIHRIGDDIYLVRTDI